MAFVLFSLGIKGYQDLGIDVHDVFHLFKLYRDDDACNARAGQTAACCSQFKQYMTRLFPAKPYVCLISSNTYRSPTFVQALQTQCSAAR